MNDMRIKILLLILVSGFLSSCFEDESNLEITPISPINIDLGDISTNLSVFSMDTLRINPIVYKKGTNDADLSYEWVLKDEDGVPTVLGNTMQLNAEITVPASSNAYDLLLIVTDNETGLQGYSSFSVEVKPTLGKGLLIADTKDEQTSDLNLIMSSNFSISPWLPYSDKDAKIFYSIFSKYNGRTIEGLVNGIEPYATTYGGEGVSLTVTTPQTILRMHPHEYIVEKVNKEVFFIAPIGEFIPQDIAYDDNNRSEFIKINGLVYSRRTTQVEKYYGAALTAPLEGAYSISQWYIPGVYNNYAQPYFYDEIKNRFLSSEGEQTDFISIETETTVPFDPNNIGAKDALYMGPGFNYLYTLFKSENAEEYSLYIASPKYLYPFAAYKPLSIYDFSEDSHIEDAIAYTSSIGEPVFYWATESAIYSLNTDSKKMETCLSIADLAPDDPSAKITSIKIWAQSLGKIRVKDPSNDKGYSEKSAQNNMMLVTVYNGTYGKVICVPIPNMGSGMLEKDHAFHRVYEGQDGNRFGRIVFVSPQRL